LRLLSSLICKIRSLYYTSKIDEGGGRIIITEPFLKFSISKHKSAKLHVRGTLVVNSHVGGRARSFISLKADSILDVQGDFVVGHGVRILLSRGSSLTIGGRDKESGSGITADTLIMVNKKIEIGKDFVCAWSVFITDSDWHTIKGQSHQGDVVIGDHVWIANNNNILKGTRIGNNCIVASNSKIINKVFPDNVLIGGLSSKILKEGIEWSRDI
jgi:acetyltransferase-like isoleucine patch superfamily enzyme